METTPGTKPKPRIILEMQPDGTLIVESYTNGARSRETLYRGFEMVAIMDELNRQKTLIESAAERKAVEQERREAALHRRVWHGVAGGTSTSRGHGVAFANKTVGPLSRTPKEPKPAPISYATADLLF